MPSSAKTQARYRNRKVSVQYAVCCAIMVLVAADSFASSHSVGGRVFSAGLTLALVVFLVRIVRSSTIVVSRDHLIVRKMFRSYRLNWDEIVDIRVAPTVSAHGNKGHQILVERVGGKILKDGEFFSRARPDGVPTLVDEVVRDLGERLAEMRS